MGMTFITGASSGIGRSLARRLAADGERIVVVARRQPLLDTLVEEIEQAGGQAMAIACDVTDRAAGGAPPPPPPAPRGATPPPGAEPRRAPGAKTAPLPSARGGGGVRPAPRPGGGSRERG